MDCGLFQGYKQLRSKNWAPPPFAPGSVDAEVLLTHAHIDHSGYLLALVKNVFSSSRIALARRVSSLKFCWWTQPICRKKKRASPTKSLQLPPARPGAVYHRGRARSDSPLHGVNYNLAVKVASDVEAIWRPNGHMIGPASVQVKPQPGVALRFFGGRQRPNDPLMRAPTPVEFADYLVLESTGNRRHPIDGTLDALREVITNGIACGSVLIPAFAVGRAQPFCIICTSSLCAVSCSRCLCSTTAQWRLTPRNDVSSQANIDCRSKTMAMSHLANSCVRQKNLRWCRTQSRRFDFGKRWPLVGVSASP